ncbi:ApeA N-terminal domain 1-containing protein [Enterobacter cloacae]|uniref:ApeA N-terminal domain 1-containing protein n=1 Tax=Enterobacter cloacae TaxID=550 RepID=UPI0022E921D5|nr:HEPN domain-containing protein [Enterobacter cloacae]MDA2943338.1 hypothetical protein [Enterobacter cloacae]
MRVEEVFKKTGYFWLPDNEGHKIPGVLSIMDGGKIELEIIGDFGDNFQFFSEDNIPRIVGHIEDDGLLTLDDCFYLTRNFSFGGISKSKIFVHKALIGATWEKDERVTFNTLSFEVDCLDEWIGITGISVEYCHKEKNASITYNPPKVIGIDLDVGMKLEICFAYTLPRKSRLKEAKITQRVYFKLSTTESRDLNDFTAMAFKIVNLMCFAMDEVISMKNLVATSNDIQRSGSGERKYPALIKIFYQSIPYSDKIPNRSFHDMLFSYSTIEENAQQVFNNWINAYESLSPAFSLYFSNKNGAHKYLDGKFLTLAQGLETYHRRTSNETLMTAEKFEALVSKILDACPEENVDWLKGRLTHGNEINLGKRLKRIIEPFKERIGTSGERSKLLRKIVDTRNYLTHYSTDLESKAAKSRELLIICNKMEAIFNLHFLTVVGFNDVEINRVIDNCYPLKSKLGEKLQIKK